MDDPDEYINCSQARDMLKVSNQTLRSWADKDKIRIIRTPSNRRMYHKQDIYDIMGRNTVVEEKQKIIYARVSSKKQMDDLERQTDFLKSRFPDYILVTDVGSGINWKRKGLKTILEQSMLGNIQEVVVAHRDRLCRFAFELIEFIFKSNNVKLVVCDEDLEKSTEQELTEDLLSIIHVYSCRSMGRRRYKNKDNTNVSNSKTGQDDEELDEYSEVCI
jgi:predicted site-specific integrase-resolvase